MATSGSSNWTQIRKQMIQQILEICNMVGVGVTPPINLVNMVSTHLNQYVKHLQTTHQVKLWKLEWLTKTFSAASEVMATDATIWTCIRSHTSSATTKPVTGADHTTFWKQKGSTGGVWVDETAYTSTGDFTDSTNDLIGIENAFLRKDGVDREITLIGHNEYMELSDKGTFGDPINIWFDNKISPTMFLYPQLNDTDDVIHYNGIIRTEDFDSNANNADFPTHWFLPIVWNVALIVAVIGEVEDRKYAKIKRNADSYLKEILESTQETPGDLIIEPDIEGYDPC